MIETQRFLAELGIDWGNYSLEEKRNRKERD